MVPLVPMEGLASRLMPVGRLSREVKPAAEREISASNWLNPPQPQMMANRPPPSSINDLCNPFEQSEEFMIAINDSKLADIVDNEMKQTNWLDIRSPVIQGFNPSANTRGPNETRNQSDPRTNLIQAAKSSNPVQGYQTMGGSWTQGAPKSSGGRRCVGPTAGSTNPFGPQQGIPEIVTRMTGPIHRMNPSVPKGPMDPKLIPGAPNQHGLGPRLPAGLRPDRGFDPRSIRSQRVVDVKQQLRTLETQFRPTMNQESPAGAFGLNFGSPSSSGLQMSPEATNEDQMDIDFILHQPSPATGPTFTIEILGEQGMLTQ